ncbi:MAG: Beta-lactamase [Myxococcales bacterium]|nr:Beta-lactamase [Myxococcales bacterium]
MRSRSHWKKYVVVVALLACDGPRTEPAPTAVPTPAATRSSISTPSTPSLPVVDAFVRAEMTRQQIPGVAVAVIRDGVAVHRAGYGIANLEHDVPVTPSTIFQSGSMGKQFTSALVMMLVEDGKLALDASIATYFPDAPAGFRAVTVRHLLTHTSGIPDYTTDAFDFRADYTEDQLRAFAFAQTLEFAPGTRWSYSNTGYALLGFLIRRVTGVFYGDLLRDRIFVPLKMTTARVISEADIIPHRAAGYQRVDGKLAHHEWVSPSLNTTADGALYYSLDDVILWDRALRAGALLQPTSWKQMYTPVALASGKTYGYGFGWFVDPVRGHTVHRHSGAWQGFKTDIVRYPDDDLTVIVLCNLAEANPEALSNGIVQTIAPELVEPAEGPAIPDDPVMTTRVWRLLDEAARGVLSREELAHTQAGFAAVAEEQFPALLGKLGAPTSLVLRRHVERGDDQLYTYSASYGEREFSVAVMVAPDGKLSKLSVRPR